MILPPLLEILKSKLYTVGTEWKLKNEEERTKYNIQAVNLASSKIVLLDMKPDEECVCTGCSSQACTSTSSHVWSIHMVLSSIEHDGITWMYDVYDTMCKSYFIPCTITKYAWG
jgi:hypothetical protein